MAEPYIPSHKPFHVEKDGYRIWQTESGGFLVSHPNSYLTYRGRTLKDAAEFIIRERNKA